MSIYKISFFLGFIMIFGSIAYGFKPNTDQRYDWLVILSIILGFIIILADLLAYTHR